MSASAELVAYFTCFQRKFGGDEIKKRRLPDTGIARKGAYMAAEHGFHFVGSPAVAARHRKERYARFFIYTAKLGSVSEVVFCDYYNRLYILPASYRGHFVNYQRARIRVAHGRKNKQPVKIRNRRAHQLAAARVYLFDSVICPIRADEYINLIANERLLPAFAEYPAGFALKYRIGGLHKVETTDSF